MAKTKRNHKRGKRHSKTKKVWLMKGCAHSFRKKCASCKYKQKGGQCSACNSFPVLKGGSFYKPAAPIPGPFVGQPWESPVSGWPGVNGVGADRNYLQQNMYYQDPQTMMKLEGGKRRKQSKRKGKGGGIIPQSITNLGRDISFNTGSMYNALNGYPAPVNPAPYKDQIPNASKSLLL